MTTDRREFAMRLSPVGLIFKCQVKVCEYEPSGHKRFVVRAMKRSSELEARQQPRADLGISGQQEEVIRKAKVRARCARHRHKAAPWRYAVGQVAHHGIAPLHRRVSFSQRLSLLLATPLVSKDGLQIVVKKWEELWP